MECIDIGLFISAHWVAKERTVMSAFEDAREYRRRRAVELVQQGESKDLVCRIFGVTTVSLNLWLRKVKEGENLKNKTHPGRPRSLNSQQLAELEQLLK